MNTDDLITRLAYGAGAVPRHAVARRLLPVLPVGLLASATGAGLALGYVPMALLALPGPLFKLAYAALMAGAALWLCLRLARPGARSGAPTALVAGVALAAALIGLEAWWLTPPEARGAAVRGHSWSWCPLAVLTLSLPALGAALGALRRLAPVRPRAAGFAAGLLAGALGAAGYALACTELAPTFVAIWYSAGMLASGALGAWLGPRCLRW